MSTTLAIALSAVAMTLIVGPVTIAIGWFAYRPLLSLAIIGGGVVLAALVLFLKRRGASASAPPERVVLGRGG